MRLSCNSFGSECTRLSSSSDILLIIEEYMCRTYALKTRNDVKKGRYEFFEKTRSAR